MRKLENISLKDYNSFGVDVHATCLIEFSDNKQLNDIFADGKMDGKPWNIISGGNNILFSGDYKGILLHPVAKNIEVISETPDSVRVKVGGGLEWDDFVEWCVSKELWGAENLSIIPGYVGAAPVQNIGAYGVEAKDIIESVEMFCVETGKTLVLTNEFCDFGYRESVFKQSLKGKVIITQVNFMLSKQPKPNLGYGDLSAAVEALGGPTLRNIRSSVISIRESKLPDPKVMGNAGSFFKNPVVEVEFAEKLKDKYPTMPLYPAEGGAKLAAGWLIDQCGWKGHKRDRVGVHEKQALVLVNLGGATGQDVLNLARDIQKSVKERFSVEIEMEVNVY